MDAKILISVEQLYRYYGHYLAVEGISFELNQGEVLGLLGPNGAGKSSTMQMISGNLAPNAGQICIAGECACPDDLELCGASCVDTSTDPHNCGERDNVLLAPISISSCLSSLNSGGA